MSHNPHANEHARHVSEQTMALMTQYGVAPTPENYELWFTYASGLNPALKRAVDSWIESGAPYTDMLAGDWHRKFISQARADEAFIQIGERFGTELERLSQSLESAGEATSIYGNTLRGAAGALGSDASGATARVIVEKLILATRQMESRSKGLEERLHASTSEVRALREDIETIRKQVLTDPLTGIANRKCFDERLRDAIADAARDGTPLTLLMGDIDHFKKFNDAWGHQTGDQVLRLVARCLTENTKGRDTAARYGGEEFAVILPATPADAGMKLGDQIRRSVQTKKVIKRSTGATLGTITMSLGVAELRPGEDASLLIERADAALYAAKRAGRNCVRSEFDPDVTPLLPPDPQQDNPLGTTIN